MPYYHYTSLSKLKEIYSSKLRMSSSNNVREDGNESSVIRDMFKTLQSSDTDVFKLLAKRLSVKEDINVIIEKLNSYRSNSYILCLSETDTNEHLWENYADKGMGVVIELRDEFLPPNIPCISGENTRGNHKRHEGISLFPMIYGYNDFKNYLASILREENPVLPSLYILMDLIKGECHQNEKETRMLYCPGENKKTLQLFKK